MRATIRILRRAAVCLSLLLIGLLSLPVAANKGLKAVLRLIDDGAGKELATQLKGNGLRFDSLTGSAETLVRTIEHHPESITDPRIIEAFEAERGLWASLQTLATVRSGCPDALCPIGDLTAALAEVQREARRLATNHYTAVHVKAAVVSADGSDPAYILTLTGKEASAGRTDLAKRLHPDLNPHAALDPGDQALLQESAGLVNIAAGAVEKGGSRLRDYEERRASLQEEMNPGDTEVIRQLRAKSDELTPLVDEYTRIRTALTGGATDVESLATELGALLIQSQALQADLMRVIELAAERNDPTVAAEFARLLAVALELSEREEAAFAALKSLHGG